jgi:S-phase kinase-associated protein 1
MDSTASVCLVSVKDGTKVDIDPRGARLSGFLKGLLEEYKDEKEIQIPEIKGEFLKHIGTFLNHYKEEEPKDVPKPLPKYDIAETYGKWDDEYIKQFESDKYQLWELMEAANYLDCKPLLELCASKVAVTIKDYSGKEILDYFGLEEDMTDEDVKKMEEEFEKEREAEREAERQKEIEAQKEKEQSKPQEI